MRQSRNARCEGSRNCVLGPAARESLATEIAAGFAIGANKRGLERKNRSENSASIGKLTHAETQKRGGSKGVSITERTGIEFSTLDDGATSGIARKSKRGISATTLRIEQNFSKQPERGSQAIALACDLGDESGIGETVTASVPRNGLGVEAGVQANTQEVR